MMMERALPIVDRICNAPFFGKREKYILPLFLVSSGILAVYFETAYSVFLLLTSILSLLKNRSEIIISSIIIVTLLFDQTIIQRIGFPSLGFNLLDLLLFFLAFNNFYLLYKHKKPIGDSVSFKILFLFFVASISLLAGIKNGFPLRGVLRDYRLFVYLLIIYFNIAWSLKDKEKIWFILNTLFVFAIFQFILVASKKIILNPVMIVHKTYIFGAGANLSVWHFIAEYSFFPFVISFSLLVNSFHQLAKKKILYFIFIAVVSLLVIMLAFNRSLYTIIPFVLMWALVKKYELIPLKKRRFLLKWVCCFFLCFFFVFLLAVFLAKIFNQNNFTAALVDRIFYFKNLSEISIRGRLLDARFTFEQVLKNPIFGYGLGSDAAPPSMPSAYRDLAISGTGMHMGYLWLAYRTGLCGLFIFIIILWKTFRNGNRFIRLCQNNDLDRGLMTGLLCCLLLLILQALSSTNMVFFKELPYWGITIGLINSLFKMHLEKETVNEKGRS